MLCALNIMISFCKTVDDFEEGFVVTQRIEIVLIKPPATVMIEAVIRGGFAKVALDGRDALLQESENLLLIPLNGLRIGEVEHGIFVGHATIGIANVHIAVYYLLEEAVLGGEVRQLPQTGVEAVFLQLLQHTHGIFETVLCKLVVALPVYTKPTRIEVDDV